VTSAACATVRLAGRGGGEAAGDGGATEWAGGGRDKEERERERERERRGEDGGEGRDKEQRKTERRWSGGHGKGGPDDLRLTCSSQWPRSSAQHADRHHLLDKTPFQPSFSRAGDAVIRPYEFHF
jgi:hypothetical protein